MKKNDDKFTGEFTFPKKKGKITPDDERILKKAAGKK
jgi:hypothetical protein